MKTDEMIFGAVYVMVDPPLNWNYWKQDLHYIQTVVVVVEVSSSYSLDNYPTILSKTNDSITNKIVFLRERKFPTNRQKRKTNLSIGVRFKQIHFIFSVKHVALELKLREKHDFSSYVPYLLFMLIILNSLHTHL